MINTHQVFLYLFFFTFVQSGMAINIVTDPNFVPTLQKLLTGSCVSGSDMRSDVVSFQFFIM